MDLRVPAGGRVQLREARASPFVWVLWLPHALRFLAATDPDALTPVLGVALAQLLVRIRPLA